MIVEEYRRGSAFAIERLSLSKQLERLVRKGTAIPHGRRQSRKRYTTGVAVFLLGLKKGVFTTVAPTR